MTSPTPASTQADSYKVVHLKIYAEDVEATKPPDVLVFNNGRQQVLVTVSFELHKNGSPHAISVDDAKRAVTLVHFESLTPIASSAIRVFMLRNEYEYNLRYLQEAWGLSRAIDDALTAPDFDATHFGATVAEDASAGTFVFNEKEWDTAFFRSALERARARAAIGHDAPSWPMAPAPIEPIAGNSTPDSTMLASRHVLQFYVSTSIAGIAPAKIAVGASVSWLPGSATPLAHTGEPDFRSSVNIVPVNFPDAGMAGFGDRIGTSSALEDHKYDSKSKQVDVYEQYLTVKLNQLTVPLRNVTAAGFVNSLHRHNGKAGSREWAMTYYGQPSSTEVIWDEFADALYFGNSGLLIPAYYLSQLMKTAAPYIREPDRTRVVIGALMGNQHCQFRNKSGKNVPDENVTTFIIEDVYGNRHGINIILKDDEFNYVRLQ